MQILATDREGLQAQQLLTVRVEEGNRPPVLIKSVEDVTVKTGSEISLDLSSHVHDPDGDTVTFWLTGSKCPFVL